nr:hypothetical protein CPGR_00665 [Mycolicibacterium fortuitum subsp. fortuitum DSM 46621 = ATCC 6841 = JCM 6387]
MIKEPQPLLRIGQREDLWARLGHQWIASAPILTETYRQFSHGRRIEDGSNGKTGIQACVNRIEQSHGGQRIATQIEERVVDPDLLQSQDLGIYPGQDLFFWRARGAVGVGVGVLRCW